MVYVQLQEYRRAEETLKRGLEGGTFLPRNTGALGYCYAIQGDEDRARDQLIRLTEIAAESSVDPCFEAWIHAGLSDDDAAIAALDRAYDRDANWLVSLKVDPFFTELRPDPRFQDLLRRMHLIEG
jgi:hypothetical protein